MHVYRLAVPALRGPVPRLGLARDAACWPATALYALALARRGARVAIAEVNVGAPQRLPPASPRRRAASALVCDVASETVRPRMLLAVQEGGYKSAAQ
jgi:hypothetical protein